MKLTKNRVITTLLTLILAFALTVSLAGCGKDNAGASPDDREVVGEEKEAEAIENQPDVKVLDGRYEADGESGLLKWFVIGPKNAYEDSVSGAGKYEISGAKLSVHYDNGAFVSYVVKSTDGGKTLTLDDAYRFVWVDAAAASALPYELYTFTADDPYPGLIAGTISMTDSNTKRPPRLVVDIAELENYVRGNLQDSSIISEESKQPFLDASFIVIGGDANGETVTYGVARDSFELCELTKEYGIVLTYSAYGNTRVTFDVDRSLQSDFENTPIFWTTTEIKYSLSLSRPLSQAEYFKKSFCSTKEEWRELWPEDYAKYVQ